MSQVHGDFLQRPASGPHAMSKVVTQIMKGHAGNTLPFVMGSLLLDLYLEMFHAPFGEMIWSPLLA